MNNQKIDIQKFYSGIESPGILILVCLWCAFIYFLVSGFILVIVWFFGDAYFWFTSHTYQVTSWMLSTGLYVWLGSCVLVFLMPALSELLSPKPRETHHPKIYSVISKITGPSWDSNNPVGPEASRQLADGRYRNHNKHGYHENDGWAIKGPDGLYKPVQSASCNQENAKSRDLSCNKIKNPDHSNETILPGSDNQENALPQNKSNVKIKRPDVVNKPDTSTDRRQQNITTQDQFYLERITQALEDYTPDDFYHDVKKYQKELSGVMNELFHDLKSGEEGDTSRLDAVFGNLVIEAKCYATTKTLKDFEGIISGCNTGNSHIILALFESRKTDGFDDALDRIAAKCDNIEIVVWDDI